MKLLETTQKYETSTEIEAKDLVEQFRLESNSKGYSIKKATYEYKAKKSKGEVTDECWVVTVIQTFGILWEDA